MQTANTTPSETLSQTWRDLRQSSEILSQLIHAPNHNIREISRTSSTNKIFANVAPLSRTTSGYQSNISLDVDDPSQQAKRMKGIHFSAQKQLTDVPLVRYQNSLEHLNAPQALFSGFRPVTSTNSWANSISTHPISSTEPTQPAKLPFSDVDESAILQKALQQYKSQASEEKKARSQRKRTLRDIQVSDLMRC